VVLIVGVVLKRGFTVKTTEPESIALYTYNVLVKNRFSMCGQFESRQTSDVFFFVQTQHIFLRKRHL